MRTICVLGLHVNAAPLPPLDLTQRARCLAQLQSVQADMDSLLDEEAAEWLQKRGHDSHDEDRPTKEFYRMLVVRGLAC